MKFGKYTRQSTYPFLFLVLSVMFSQRLQKLCFIKYCCMPPLLVLLIMYLAVFCLCLSVPDSVSLRLCSIIAKHTGGVPEESFGSLPEVGTEPCCSLFFCLLHPHSPQKYSVTAQAAFQSNKTKTVLNLPPYQSNIYICIISSPLTQYMT